MNYDVSSIKTLCEGYWREANALLRISKEFSLKERGAFTRRLFHCFENYIHIVDRIDKMNKFFKKSVESLEDNEKEN